MSTDLEQLLRAVREDAPAGENLEYDPGFADLERAAKGKPEQQMGDTIIPGEEPNWREVKAKAIELLSRSKDLRVAVHLTSANLRLEGFPGFRDGLALVRGLLDAFWDTLYPQLDPEDDNDPTMRINALAPLTDPDGVLRALREAVVVDSRAVGRFTYRDFQIVTGAITAPKGKEGTDLVTFDAAFSDAALESIQQTEQALAQCLSEVRTIESNLTGRVGAEQTADLSALASLLRNVHHVVAERLGRRDDAPDLDATGGPDMSDAEGEATSSPGTSVSRPAAAPGEIRTREDVIKTLDRLCDYYARNEPSSPIPLLLRRAQRLANKSFVDIIQDLAPGALSEIEKIRGVDSNSE